MLVPDSPRHADDTISPLTSRRSVIATLGLAGLGLFSGTSSASAARTSAPRPDLSKLPAAWVRLQGSALTAYAEYLRSLKLQHVTPEQVIAAHAKVRGRVWNTLPPKSMWKNMGPTLKAVDRIAAELGMPVKEITSAYRSRAYNARCPGAASGSWHQANVAVDVKFPVRASTVTSVARKVRAKGYFKGGIGSYASFTHVDTRGVNNNW